MAMERGDLAPLWMARGSAEWEQRGRRGVGRLKSPVRRRDVEFARFRHGAWRCVCWDVRLLLERRFATAVFARVAHDGSR